jgi:hypothetical protein
MPGVDLLMACLLVLCGASAEKNAAMPTGGRTADIHLPAERVATQVTPEVKVTAPDRHWIWGRYHATEADLLYEAKWSGLWLGAGGTVLGTTGQNANRKMIAKGYIRLQLAPDSKTALRKATRDERRWQTRPGRFVSKAVGVGMIAVPVTDWLGHAYEESSLRDWVTGPPREVGPAPSGR